MLEPFLITLAQELEWDESPKKDALNQFILPLNADQVISLKEVDEGVLVRARIGALPERDQEALCMDLMKGNFLGQGTGQAVIGLEEDEKFLTLSQVLPYDINFKGFKQLLEEFANYLGYWQEVLHERVVKG